MRRAAGALLFALGSMLGPAVASAKPCADPARALGVSRTLEIDTSGGPRYGYQQYKELDFLAEGEIVLTFDDGPLRPYTRPVIDALEAECTKATFFMVGQMALGDPEMVKEIHRRGHTIGTHTFTHANLRKTTPLNARREVELGFSAVQAALGKPIAPFFRFPFLADTTAMKGYAQTRGFGVFSIDADATDYKSKDPAVVHRTILNQLAETRKGILLFHDIQESTARALPGLLAALKAKGYRVVHLQPKSSVQTLPEFDAIARSEGARKQVASANEPLANRAITWPVSPAQQGAPAARPSYGPPGSIGRPTVLAGSPPPLAPYAGVYAQPPLPPVAPVQKAPRVRSDSDWRDSIFHGK